LTLSTTEGDPPFAFFQSLTGVADPRGIKFAANVVENELQATPGAMKRTVLQ
jgi:hypothetical protein